MIPNSYNYHETSFKNVDLSSPFYKQTRSSKRYVP